MANKNRSLARERRHTRVRKSVSGTPVRPRLNVFKSLDADRWGRIRDACRDRASGFRGDGVLRYGLHNS